MKTTLFRAAGASLMLVSQLVGAHDSRLGNLTIGHPYARATAAGQPTGGAFLSIENGGASEDRLIAVSVSAPIAAGAELHSMTMQGDVMQMRTVDAVALPAGKTVQLQPGGLHAMLFGLKAPLKEGTEFPLTLRFERAGEVTVTVHVEAAAADHSAHGGHADHMGHGGAEAH